ncbi:MAG: DUF4293 domain-containing protein [Bacteroidales bacterium]|nr:DUF4293 domain-containing protein [Bacteroidales bacterium]
MRIQSLYWFLSAVLMGLMLPFDWMTLVVTNGDFLLNASGINKISSPDVENVITGIPMICYIIGFILINLVCIFLCYTEKRIIQCRLTVFSIILSIAFYLLIILYRYMSFNDEVIDTMFNFPLIFPFVICVLEIFAIQSVLKDIKKIKDSNAFRIR